MKFLFLLSLVFVSLTVHAQSPDTSIAQVTNQPKTVYETAATTDISVRYARLHKPGCRIFGNLHKFGYVWTAGTDKATTITFDRNVSFAGQNVNAGTYTLFVIPYENEWTIILNTQPEQWGIYTYEKYKDKNIVNVNVPVTSLDNEIEQLTIRFPSTASMIIEWDNTQVTIPVL